MFGGKGKPTEKSEKSVELFLKTLLSSQRVFVYTYLVHCCIKVLP